MTQRCSEGYNGTGIDQGKAISAMGTKFLPKINSIFLPKNKFQNFSSVFFPPKEPNPFLTWTVFSQLLEFCKKVNNLIP